MLHFVWDGQPWLINCVLNYTLFGQPKSKHLFYVARDKHYEQIAREVARQTIHRSAVIENILWHLPVCAADDLAYMEKHKLSKKMHREDWQFCRLLSARKKLAEVA